MTDPFADRSDRALQPPLDQQPVDQQPVPPRQFVSDDVQHLPSLPQLPGAGPTPSRLDGPAIVSRPVGPPFTSPLIPPLETTSPIDFVDSESAPRLGSKVQPPVGTTPGRSEFEPLRVDPPPTLLPTWLLRSSMLVVMLAAPAMVLSVEYNGAVDDVRSSFAVLVVHLAAGVLLVVWSSMAMRNAACVVPPSRYQQRASASIAVLLWAFAAVAPIGAVAVNRRLGSRLRDPGDVAAVIIMVAVVLIAFVLLWLPFRYHARQASRVGAPHRPMLAWFFVPLVAAVGGVSAVSAGLGSTLAEGGLTATERVVQVGVAYALPMLVFALFTWRAVTVFDEVIDLRWRRWRIEWEQTLGRLADEPPPGPEDSPSIDGLIGR